MKTNKFTYSLCMAVLYFLSSCNTPEAEKKAYGSVAKDTVAAALPAALANLFKTQNTLPFLADTTLFYHIESCDSLGTNEVKILAAKPFNHALAGGSGYDLADFYRIDSIKASGNYAAWSDSLEPGNVKSSNGYAICKLDADSGNSVLVWALKTSSYEACPYFTQTRIFFTLVRNGIVGQSFILGELLSAGDPPASMTRVVSGKTNKDLTFEMNVYQESDEDMDSPEIAILRERYEFAIVNGKINLVKEERGNPKMVKRQIANN